MAIKRLYSTHALQSRLALLAGSSRRYVAWTHERLPRGSGSVEWVRKVLAGRAPVPIALAVNLIRIAEERPSLGRDEAWEKRLKYFIED